MVSCFNLTDLLVSTDLPRCCSTLFPRARCDLVEEVFRISGVSPNAQSTKLENEELRDLCYAFDEIATRIPQLRLVDTYDPKVWRRHFDEQGNPIEAISTRGGSYSHDLKDRLRDFLHDTDGGDQDPEPRKSRRERKRMNKVFNRSYQKPDL